MPDAADNFRQRYESLSDEALLEESRDELVEAARQCLDAELAKRGLTPPANAAEAEEPSADPKDEMVPAAVYSNAEEADLARALLESAGIPCFLANEHALYKFTLANGISGLPLLVAAGSLEQAREILAAPVSDEELTAQAEAAVEQSGRDDQN